MSEEPVASLYDRTLGRIGRAFRDVADQARVAFSGTLRPDLPEEDAERLARRIDLCLNGAGGEASARVRAADVGRIYLSLSPSRRHRFLSLLTQRHGIARTRLGLAIAAWDQAADDAAFERAETAMRAALVAPRVTLLTHFNSLPEGVKFLVDMRADLLRLTRSDPALAGLAEELRVLLAGWFDIGFLDLSRITWNSPAVLLEKLMDYEAVHEIRSWTDLKNRLDSDRRCFAFFHPRMPDEPLIFVEVALVDGMAGSVQRLLDEGEPPADPRQADSAIFYSISNCQKGLAGVSFGDLLIKRVVDVLTRDFPDLKIFATLSPIPGFRAWLDERLAAADASLLSPAEAQVLAALAGGEEVAAATGAARPAGIVALERLLARSDWPQDAAVCAALEAPLMRLCARYLALETGPNGVRDRVANFHLSNGARIERINWLGDTSPRGMAQSAGLMVNYRYKLGEIEANHESYKTHGIVTLQTSVKRLLKG